MAGKVYVLDHNTYENMKIAGTIESDSMYMVRETSSANPNMLSLYLGEARQADVCDITGMSVDFSDPDSNYNIPSTYWVQNKILLCKDQSGDSYRGLVYDGTKFLELGSAPLVPDEVTILTDANNVISGVGANVSGETFTVNGSSVVARDGAEIFNYISGAQTNNIATGASSHVEGASNIEGGQGDTNHIEGKGNTISASGNEAVHVEGKNNSLTGGGNKVVHIEGYNNILSGAGNNYISIRGSGNTFSASGTNDIIVDGASNNITNGGGSSILVRGQNNTVATNNFHQSDICGYGNEILSNVSGNLVYIYGYGNKVGAQSDTTSVNGLNISGRSNKFTNGSTVGLSISGDGNTVSGNLLGCTVFGYQNTFATKGDPPGLLLGGYNNTTDSNSSIHYGSAILGRGNSVSSSGGLNTAFLIGYGNTINGTFSNGAVMFGSSNSLQTSGTADSAIIAGSGNSISNGHNCAIFGASNTVNATHSLVCGSYLTTLQAENALIVGKYNFNAVDSSDVAIQVGAGTSDSSSNRKNSFVLDKTGNVMCSGNVTSSSGVSLTTIRNTLTVSADDSSYTFAILPRNGTENIISDTYTIESITITSIDYMNNPDPNNYLSAYGGISAVSRSSDYTTVLIFKKSSNLTDISTALTNFSANDNTKIYLLNPDLDITDYTIIHIMLSYDGFNMTAIAAGYEEVTPV